MNEYQIIINILQNVYLGQNLNNSLNIDEKQVNIPKIKNVCYGVLRNNFSINFIIRKLVTKCHELDNIILQIGIFEINYSKKKVYAIINDLVDLNYSITQNDKRKNFINAVLREYLRQQENLDKLIDKDYSLKYNLPNWMIDKLKIQNKKNYLQILKDLNNHPSFGIRVNLNKTRLEEYKQLLNQNHMDFEIIDNKICLLNPCSVQELPLFNEGAVSIQDVAAQYTIDILKQNHIKPYLVLDACSAPGGKACQILENYKVDLIALDIDNNRLNMVQQNMQRLNLNAKIELGDARNKDWWNGTKFDLVLADVPCSATGTIKRNPDIKINRMEYDIENFVKTQREIVSNLWDVLEKYGYLLYITCSLFNEENLENTSWIKQNLIGSELIDEVHILPTKFNDSLYYSLFKKVI